MAKVSKIEKNKQRKALVKKYEEKYHAWRTIMKSSSASFEEKEAARLALAKMPRNANPTRIVNRCELSGRPRGYYRKFGLSRIALRELALAGELPGVTKASW